MDRKVLIVTSEWYDEKIGINLVKGATKFFNKNQISFDILYAPGSFEIPFIINQNIDLYDGFVALGCIIRGETIHFELIAKECARKIMNLSIISKKPIGFGIIACENIKQAIMLSLCGVKSNFVYSKTSKNNTFIDRAIKHILKFKKKKHQVVNFREIIGADEIAFDNVIQYVGEQLITIIVVIA